jgi:hypothetical protein
MSTLRAIERYLDEMNNGSSLRPQVAILSLLLAIGDKESIPYVLLHKVGQEPDRLRVDESEFWSLETLNAVLYDPYLVH